MLCSTPFSKHYMRLNRRVVAMEKTEKQEYHLIALFKIGHMIGTGGSQAVLAQISDGATLWITLPCSLIAGIGRGSFDFDRESGFHRHARLRAKSLQKNFDGYIMPLVTALPLGLFSAFWQTLARPFAYVVLLCTLPLDGLKWTYDIVASGASGLPRGVKKRPFFNTIRHEAALARIVFPTDRQSEVTLENTLAPEKGNDF